MPTDINAPPAVVSAPVDTTTPAPAPDVAAFHQSLQPTAAPSQLPAQAQEAAAAQPQPVTLSPEYLAQSTVAPPPTAAPVTLSPDYLAKSTVTPETPKVVNPLTDWSTADLVKAARANPKDFDPVSMFESLPFYDKTPETTAKMADVFHDLQAGGNLLPSAGTIAKNAVKVPWEFAKRLFYQGGSLPGDVAALAGASDQSTTAGALAQEARQTAAETVAGTKSSLFGLAKMGDTIAKRLMGKPLADFTPADKMAAFQFELAARQKISDLAGGGEKAQELAAAGTPMRPERVSTFAQTDPFSWELMGKAFSGATQVAKLGGAAVLGTTPAEISAALSGPASALATGTAKVVGGAINKTAGAIKPVVELAGKAAPWTGKIVGGASGVTAGHALAGPLGALGGIMEGAKVGTETGERFAAGAEKIAGILDRIQDVGKQIAGSEPLVSPTAVAGRNLSLALPGAATSVASGVGFDMGLQAATANTPADREGFTPFGTVFGFAHAAGLTGSRLLSGQILAPRENGSAVKIPNTGYFPALNALHDTAYASETPGVQQRINALRALAKGGAPNTDVFFAPHPEEGQADQLPAALQASGIDPANAQNFAAQRGAFIQLKDVNGRNIVVFRDIDSAPHEVKHALDDALGSQAVEALNQDTKKQYTPQEWNAFTQHYGDLLTTTGEPAENPGAMILDKSNWGDAAAREKIIRQVHDALAAEGQDLTGPALKEAAGNAILKAQGDAQAAGTSLWEHQLTPEEQQRVLDNYIGGELRAENFQAWSNGMGASRAIPDRMATAVANLVHMLGGNPLAGATTDIGAPLNWATMRQGAEGVQALHPTIPPAKLPQVKAPVGSAKGIAQQGARDEAIVQNAPDVKLPGMAKSQREMAGALNEAKLSNSPVDIHYGHAGETAPAGGAGELPAPILGAVKRSQRRDVIEAWRSLPVETRSFMSTLFSPEQFHMTQDGKVQVYGVSHAVVAANLQKLAAMKLAHPELPLPTGVDVDPNTKSFTPESWKYLLENLSKYSANQTTGRTGSGAELVVPKMKGYNAPPVTGSAEPIPQDLADMFNAAYGQHTPTTARITKKDIVPLNIAGQRVSEATMPGRVEHPSPESPVFGEGTKEANDRAKALGISGEHVLEPNPFIQKLNAYPDAPSFIEARQRLNVEHMADVNEAPSGAPSLKGNTLTLAAGFKPQVREFLDTLQKTNPEEWRAVVDPFRGRYGGGQTGLSAEVGSQVTSPEELKQLRSAQAHYEGLAKAAFSANDIDAASSYINKAQAAREASEMAEGGGTAEFVKKYYDPNYKAPLSPGGTTSTPAQLLPPPLEQFKDDPRQSVDPERADDRTAERFFHGALDSSDETGYDSRVISAQLKPTKKDDRLELTHYSGTPGLSKLDPSFSGTGLPGAESKRARDYPELFVPRTYFGTPDYKKEPGLGNLAYKAEVRSGKIYDFQSDPKELYPTSEELESNGYAPFDQRAAVSLYEKRIHEAGYEGYINKDANAVAKFTATAVKKATPAQFSPAKPFYSQLEKTVEDKMPEAASGESLAAMLRNPQNGVKADELKWSGLDDFLKGKARVTKQEVQDYLKQNNVQVSEVVKGTPEVNAAINLKSKYALPEVVKLAQENQGSAPDALWLALQNDGDAYRALTKKFPELSDDEAWASRVAQDVFRTEGTLAGAPKFSRYQLPGGENYRELLFTRPSPESPSLGEFKSQHWDEPNVLAHARFNERTDADGKKMLFLEELQSDWHQTGRREGYQIPTRPKRDVVADMDKVMAELRERGGSNAPAETDWQAHPDLQARANSLVAEFAAATESEKAGKNGVPDAPFKNTWHEMAFRRMVRWAAEHGLDRLGWTTGEQQSERYDLSKQVDSITAFRNPDSTYSIVAEKDGEKVANPGNIQPGKLADTVGKDLADKIIANPKDSQRYSGVDLKVGGEGMKGFYDKILVDYANKFGKKFGAKSGMAQVPSDEDLHMAGWPAPGTTSVHSLDITPEMRKTAMEQGFAQFRPNAPKPEEFKSAETLPAALRAPNWAILTGTQEALGPATAPANIQNNEVLQNELKAAGFAPQTVSGSYEGVDQGKSFLVTGMTPEQALDWGKRFKQDSVLTQAGYLYHDNTVAPADHTKNSYGADAEKQPGWSQVEGGPAFSMGIDFGKREPVKQAQMELGGGATENRPLSSQELGDMSDTELRAHYPEAIVPNRVRNAAGKLVEPQIPSEIADSPLAKAEGAAGFAKKLVSMANDWKDHPAFKSGLRWYSEFTPMLKKAFGKTAGIMAEFLAATSPQTAPDQNFAYALDAHQGLASGRFDTTISKYKEGLEKLEDGTWKTWFAKEVAAGRASEPKSGPTEAAFLGQWVEKHDLLPRQSNGQKYGQNSRAVLNVLARTWLDQNTGPKTLNFVKNLLGEGHGATIDVWADRTMRRLGYEGKQDRWRILPQNKTGVSDKDFAFAQDAFKQAAKQLGVKPDALQGALWFAEKQLWADRGWGRLDFGDFREEIKKMPMLLKGIEQRLAATAARQSAPKAVQPDLLVSPRNLRK